MEKDINKKINERLRLSQLTARKLLGNITAKEKQELAEIIKKDAHLYELSERLIQQTNSADVQKDSLNDKEIEHSWKDFQKNHPSTFKRENSRNRPYIRYIGTVAAIVVIVCGVLLVKEHTLTPNKEEAIANAEDTAHITITNDGCKIYTLPFSGIESKNRIGTKDEYSSQQMHCFLPPAIINNSHCSLFKEAITENGNSFDFLTSDSSQVFLNQSSSLRYLTQFDAQKREVWLKGEAYFKVKHEEEREFLVHVDGLTVYVLGTQFNVRAYPDQPVKVTLVSGSVKIKTAKEERIINPGETATCPDNEQLKVETENNKEILAWKQNKFYFEKATMQEVAAELSKWYGIKLKCKDQETARQIVCLDYDRRFPLIHVTQKIETLDNDLIICFTPAKDGEMIAYTMNKDAYYSASMSEKSNHTNN